MSLGKSEEPEAPSATAPDAPRNLDPEALKAYAHPLRMAILRYLLDHGSATSTTLAKELGESTGQTSYHLRQLAKHGLVEEVPGKGTGRERWWSPRSTNLDLPTMLTDEATTQAAGVLLTKMLQDRTTALGRWLSAASSLREIPESSPANHSLHTETTLRMTAEEMRELTEALSAVVDEFAARFRRRRQEGWPEGAVRVRTYVDVFPLELPGEEGTDDGER